MQYVTAKRAADMTGLSEKTVRRYVDSGKLPAKKLSNGRLAIAVEHLPARRISDLDEQLAYLSMQLDEIRTENRALKRRVDALERGPVITRVEHVALSESTYSAPERHVQSSNGQVSSDLPDGWVPAIDYLLGLGMSESTARRQLRRLSHHEGKWGNGVKYAFDPEQLQEMAGK